jgi:hypothetical protein
LRWRLFGPPSGYVISDAESDIALLDDIEEASKLLSPPVSVREEYEIGDITDYPRIDKRPIYERLQRNTPVLIYASGKRLELLTKWLIALTIILSVLTLISIITRI